MATLLVLGLCGGVIVVGLTDLAYKLSFGKTARRWSLWWNGRRLRKENRKLLKLQATPRTSSGFLLQSYKEDVNEAK
jgi:hypothetical protein